MQKLTNASNAVAWQTTEQPFGETVSSTGTPDSKLRFPGQYADSESGLRYNYFRDYNPALGRYLQPDPIGQNGGLNLYGYANQNPTGTRIDRGGHKGNKDPKAQGPHGHQPGKTLPDGNPLCRYLAMRTASAAANALADALDNIRFNEKKDEEQTPAEKAKEEAAGKTKTKEPSRSNPWKGEPGSTTEAKGKDGKIKQGRRYAEDGYSEVDVDWDHDHNGVGKPHAHDVGRPADGSPPTDKDRGPPRPPRPGDPGF